MWVAGNPTPANAGIGLFAGNITVAQHTAFWTRDDTRGPYNYFETGTVDETSAGMRSTTNNISAQNMRSYWFFKFGGGATTVSSHQNIGVWNNTSFPADNALNNQHGVILNHRHTTNSERLRVLHNNGSASQTAISLGSDFDYSSDTTNSVYTFELQFAYQTNQFDYRVTKKNTSTLAFADTGWLHVSSLGPSINTDLGWTMSAITKVSSNNIEIDGYMVYCECVGSLI
jgi:hypothetical protein